MGPNEAVPLARIMPGWARQTFALSAIPFASALQQAIAEARLRDMQARSSAGAQGIWNLQQQLQEGLPFAESRLRPNYRLGK